MGDVGSTRQWLLNTIAEETETKSVHIDFRDAYIVFKVLHHNGEYETVKIPAEEHLTLTSSIVQDVLIEIRKHSDSIKLDMELDEHGWFVGVTC